MPGYVSLGLNAPMPVEVGKSVVVKFDRELSDDGKRHQDKTAAPGILIGGAKGTLYDAHVEVDGPATWDLIETNPDDKYSVHDTNHTGGPDVCDPKMHLWLRLHPTGTGTVNVHTKCLYWDR